MKRLSERHYSRYYRSPCEHEDIVLLVINRIQYKLCSIYVIVIKGILYCSNY